MYDLDNFRKRITSLYHAADPFPDHHRPTQQDLAREVGLASAELSRRLHGANGYRLSADNVQAIVRTLAKWRAITTQAEAVELLRLVDARPFETTLWQQPPLNQLSALSEQQQLHFAHASDNLPTMISSFVGREAELEEAAAFLETTRLLTITGMGGMGKTRFALELAHRLRGKFADGIWLVELAALAEPALLVRRIGAVVGVGEESGQNIEAALVEHLRPRQTLLVLDNCEHLLAACTSLVTTLLRGCPLLKVLATSREALVVLGERELPLPPLALPTAEHSIGQLSDSTAVQLFVQRAKAAQPRFQLASDNAAAVAEICRRLDGIPLAIELAAPLVKALSVSKIAQRLDDRFRLLRAPERGADYRHQTLRACIEWSDALLTDQQRTLLHRLAVFADSWSLEAAEVVCADAVLKPVGVGQPHAERLDSSNILEAHVQLLQKSLLLAEPHGGEMRYRMLVTVHEYAQEQLTRSGDEAMVQQQHAQLFLALAERAAANLQGPDQLLWLDQYELEHDNLRAALRWAIEQQQTALALRLCNAMWLFWRWRSYISEGYQWLTAALALPGEQHSVIRARALKCVGDLAWLERNDYDAAKHLIGQALAIHRQLGNHRGVAAALTNLGLIAKIQGDTAKAIALFEESLSIDQQQGDRVGIVGAYVNLGEAYYNGADYANAEDYFQRALALGDELQDADTKCIALLGLGDIVYDRADYPAARKLYQQSLDLANQLKSSRRTAAQLALANVDYMQGHNAAAYDNYLAVLTHLAIKPDSVSGSYAVLGMGIVLAAMASGADDIARAIQATTLLAAAEASLAALSVPIERNMQRNADLAANTLRQILGADRFAEVWEQGASIDLKPVVASLLAPQAALVAVR